MDICEIITRDGIVVCQTAKQAESILSKMPACLRLDLHKTLDTLDPNISIFETSQVCCISYVGRSSDIRNHAREDILDRIKYEQIEYGVLVFKRGKNINEPFTEDGSKAWANKYIPFKDFKPLFIDDSADHVLSVNSIGILSVQIQSNDSLFDLLDLVSC